MEEPPNPNKRLRRVPRVSSSTGEGQNPNHLPSVPGLNQNHVDMVISSLFSLPDLHSSSSASSIRGSFDRAVEKLFKASGDEFSQNRLADRGAELAALLHESTLRCSLKRATLHNSISWPLPLELTAKVFSKLDTVSLMQASACCTMFNKYAMDPVCYSHIDLTTEGVNVQSRVVRSMILNAGKELRSLKVGCSDESEKCLLTRSCLTPLTYDHGFLGNLLESLHLYNDKWLDSKSLCTVLSVCSNITDLKIVGLNVDSIDKVFDSLTSKCQHVFLENGPDRSCTIHGLSFESNCPNITSITLEGFDISDKNAYHLINGLRKLKYMNLTRTFTMKGCFLRDASLDCKDSLLETLILQDCLSLEEGKVFGFLNLLIEGHFRFLRYLEVSDDRGILYSCRCNLPKFPLAELKEARPGLTFVADFRSSAPVSHLSLSPSSSFSSSSLGDSSLGSVSEDFDDW